MDFEMSVKSVEDAKMEIQASRSSKYQPVLEQWQELDTGSDESLLLSGLSKSDIQGLRSLFYRTVGKENVIVRSAQQPDDSYKALIRERNGDEYLRTEE